MAYTLALFLTAIGAARAATKAEVERLFALHAQIETMALECVPATDSEQLTIARLYLRTHEIEVNYQRSRIATIPLSERESIKLERDYSADWILLNLEFEVVIPKGAVPSGWKTDVSDAVDATKKYAREHKAALERWFRLLEKDQCFHKGAGPLIEDYATLQKRLIHGFEDDESG